MLLLLPLLILDNDPLFQHPDGTNMHTVMLLPSVKLALAVAEAVSNLAGLNAAKGAWLPGCLLA